MSDSENSLRLFLNGFTARDIADSLASFDDAAVADTIRTAMEAQQLDVVGIRKSGVLSGWLMRDDLANGSEPLGCRPFESTSAVAETASCASEPFASRAFG